MKIVLLTQNDPFFLAETFKYFFSKLPKHMHVVACVVFEPSPFGKKLSTFGKVKKTIHTFGFGFFLHFAIKLVLNKLNPNKSVNQVLRQYGAYKIILNKNINHNESLSKIDSFKPDVLVSVTGNQIFRKPLLELAPYGCINLHSSLLPKYRGIMPSFWVLKNKEEKTGVSVFFVNEGIDTGPILVQKEILIGNRTQDQLIRDSKMIGMDAIVESLTLIDAGAFELQENDDNHMTYFSFPTKRDVAEFKKNGKKFY